MATYPKLFCVLTLQFLIWVATATIQTDPVTTNTAVDMNMTIEYVDMINSEKSSATHPSPFSQKPGYTATMQKIKADKRSGIYPLGSHSKKTVDKTRRDDRNKEDTALITSELLSASRKFSTSGKMTKLSHAPIHLKSQERQKPVLATVQPLIKPEFTMQQKQHNSLKLTQGCSVQQQIKHSPIKSIEQNIFSKTSQETQQKSNQTSMDTAFQTIIERTEGKKQSALNETFLNTETTTRQENQRTAIKPFATTPEKITQRENQTSVNTTFPTTVSTTQRENQASVNTTFPATVSTTQRENQTSVNTTFPTTVSTTQRENQTSVNTTFPTTTVSTTQRENQTSANTTFPTTVSTTQRENQTSVNTTFPTTVSTTQRENQTSANTTFPTATVSTTQRENQTSANTTFPTTVSTTQRENQTSVNTTFPTTTVSTTQRENQTSVNTTSPTTVSTTQRENQTSVNTTFPTTVSTTQRENQTSVNTTSPTTTVSTTQGENQTSVNTTFPTTTVSTSERENQTSVNTTSPTTVSTTQRENQTSVNTTSQTTVSTTQRENQTSVNTTFPTTVSTTQRENQTSVNTTFPTTVSTTQRENQTSVNTTFPTTVSTTQRENQTSVNTTFPTTVSTTQRENQTSVNTTFPTTVSTTQRENQTSVNTTFPTTVSTTQRENQTSVNTTFPTTVSTTQRENQTSVNTTSPTTTVSTTQRENQTSVNTTFPPTVSTTQRENQTSVNTTFPTTEESTALSEIHTSPTYIKPTSSATTTNMQNETSPNTTKPATSERLTETTQAPTITITSKSTIPNLTISTPMQTTPNRTTTPTTTLATTTPTPTTTTPTTTPRTTPSVTSMPTSALPLTTTTRTLTTPKDPCNPNPCKNNGSCIVTNEYVCICPSNWTGIDCSESAVCEKSTYRFNNGPNVTFDKIQLGSIGFSREICQENTPNAGSSLATRHCMRNGSLKLSTPEKFDCSMNLQGVLSFLNDSTSHIKKEKAASQVVNLTKNPQKLTVASVASTTDILTTIMEDPIALKIETFINIIQTFCNLLEANPDIIIEALANLESLTQPLENLIVFNKIDQVCPQVAVKSNEINFIDNSTGSGLVLYQNNALNLTKTAIKSVSKEDDINNEKLEAYIFIPNNSFKADVHFGFVLYKDASFFPTPKKKDSIVMKTQVISGTVANHTGNLEKPVIIKLRTKELNDGFYLKYHQCAYWNYTEKEWQTNGCYINGIDNGTHFTCECFHLTSFAVLMTVKGKTLQYLDTISYIGCALSILGLLATIIAPMWMRDYRASVNGKLQINLSVALLGVYITFLAGAINPTWANASPEKTASSEKTSKLGNPFCTASTWFLHFFLLASFAWMCVQGIALFSSFNRIIQQMERSYFVAVSAGVAWGAAALIAIITIAAKGPAGYRQERICWLAVPDDTTATFFSEENVLFWAFMLPVALVLILNLVIFGLIMSKMVCNKRNLKSYRGDFKQTLQKHFVVIFANTVTLGVCWITGYLMLIEAAYEVFSTLFCILNSLQGIFIFLLCFMNVKEFQNRMLQPFKVLKRVKKSNISMSNLIIKGD
ncbi:uncharacterized protein [Scyliorhinus torazame]|uniref:uncharacterized protein n=1 Tax=Scyliorhinus torazame TaxID=75743 RepID=UPI003B5C2D68